LEDPIHKKNNIKVLKFTEIAGNNEDEKEDTQLILHSPAKEEIQNKDQCGEGKVL